MGIENPFPFTPSREDLSTDALDGSETPEEAREKDENYQRKREESEDGGEINPDVNPESDRLRKITLIYDSLRADPVNKDIEDEALMGMAEKKAQE